MAGKARAIRWVDVVVGIGAEARLLVKTLTAAGDFIHRRVDLQKDPTPLLSQLLQGTGPNPRSPQLGRDGKVLHIAKGAGFPPQKDALKLLALHQQVKVVPRAAQTDLLSLLCAPLMDGKALFIQGKGRRKAPSLGWVK